MLRSNSISLGNHVVSPAEVRKATVGKIYRKGRFLAWNERVSG